MLSPIIYAGLTYLDKILDRVETKFDDVVHQGEERRQGKGGDKESDKSILQDHFQILVEQTKFRHGEQLVVFVQS